MQSPFPGMDPYLEAPNLCPDVHNSLSSAIRDQIQPSLAPRYVAVLTPYVEHESIEVATNRTIIPDVGIFQRNEREYHASATAVSIAPAPMTGLLNVPTRYYRVEILTTGTEELVTVIEILSPANKRSGADGADAYERKRRDLVQSPVHLLELDLLRGGRRPQLATPLPDAPYFIILSRVEQRPHVDIWPLSLQHPIPIVPVPLQAGDADVPLDLGQALQRIYASARYDLRIDYRAAPPPPALSPADALWLKQHVPSNTGILSDSG